MRWRSILSGSNRLSKVYLVISLLPTLFLLITTLRRWLFTWVALWSRTPHVLPDATSGWEPDVLLLVPFRDEAAALPRLIAALRQLDYPASSLMIVFIDDGSRDGGAMLCMDACSEQANWRLLQLAPARGKAAALNQALERFQWGQYVAVYDADERPSADALRELVRTCRPTSVAAASGRRALSNPLVSATTSYVAFENVVHQLVTLRAQDRLALAPAVLGSNCLYRRLALDDVGHFRAGASLEDSDLTLRLAAAGWRIRFAPDAISLHAAPETIGSYWRQHVRWASGFQDVAQRQLLRALREKRISRRLRLDLALFSLGYADRLALMALVGFAYRDEIRSNRARLWRALLLLVFVTPLLQVIAALYIARAPLRLWLRLPLLPAYALVDAAMAVTGIGLGLVGRMPAWERRRLAREMHPNSS